MAALLLASAGCARTPAKLAPHVAFSGPVSNQTSSAKERQQVSITVYNQNFALVREVRNVKLGQGLVSLEFRDVSAHIQPQTVHIKALDDETAVSVLEQNFRYDLLTPATLLDKYVGKRVRVYRMNDKLGREEGFDADVLSVEQGKPVLRVQGEVTYDFPGRIAFPAVPANLIPKPTLVWLLGSTKPEQRLEVSYLTQNLNWTADYVLVVDENDARGELTGWVTLANTSGASYENASLKLVAGDVQRVTPPPAPPPMPLPEMAMGVPGMAQFREQSFFEYHLYTLERPVSVLEREQKQVTLLEAHGIGLTKKLIFYGAESYYRGGYGQIVSGQKVGVFFDFKNSSANQLGVPLPKGIVRVYKMDANRARQFLGEDAIEHTPRDEELRIKLGEAFDVVGDRKQTEWVTLGGCAAESSWEITLRNHKHSAQAVEVFEPIGGEWKMLRASHPHEKRENHSFSFQVGVPARGEAKIAYRVRVRWC
jgi:hypothetical protein